MAITLQQRRLKEKTSAKYTATLRDQDDVVIPLADINALTLTLYNVVGGAIINSRNAQNVLNANGVTVHATSGLLTWTIAPEDNAIIDTTLAAGSYEKHIALFEFTYSGTRKGKHEVEIFVKQLDKVT